MPRKVRIPQDPTQARANQQRSRARRREHVEDLERRLREYEARGARASLEMQAASRHVAWKNDRLMDMLVEKAGVERWAVERHLAAEWAALTTMTTSPAAAALSGADVPLVMARNGWSPAGSLIEEQHGLHLLSAAAAAGEEDVGGTDTRRYDGGGCSSIADASTGTLIGQVDKRQSQEDGHQRFPARNSDSDADESLSPPPPTPGGYDRATTTDYPAGATMRTTTICGPALLQVPEGSTQTVEMTSCDDAVDMIANLRGHGDATDARELLGCPSSGNCKVKNARLFQLMVETN